MNFFQNLYFLETLKFKLELNRMPLNQISYSYQIAKIVQDFKSYLVIYKFVTSPATKTIMMLGAI